MTGQGGPAGGIRSGRRTWTALRELRPTSPQAAAPAKAACSRSPPVLLPAGGGGRNQCHGARTDRASCARSRAPNDRLHVGFDDDGNEIDEGSRRRTAAGRLRWPGRLRGGYAAKALAYHPSYVQHTGVPDPTEIERRRWAAEDLTNRETSSSGWPGPEPRQSTRRRARSVMAAQQVLAHPPVGVSSQRSSVVPGRGPVGASGVTAAGAGCPVRSRIDCP